MNFTVKSKEMAILDFRGQLCKAGLVLIDPHRGLKFNHCFVLCIYVCISLFLFKTSEEKTTIDQDLLRNISTFINKPLENMLCIDVIYVPTCSYIDVILES